MGPINGITLEQILDDTKLSKLFLEFVLKAHAQDNLEFWLEVEIYKRIEDGLHLQRMGKRFVFTMTDI
jgi:hypothetical protein